MPSAAFQKFSSFTEAMAEKSHNLQTDVLKVALTNTAPLASNTVIANITQIAAGNGYTTGGNTATQSSSSQASAGLYRLILADVVFTPVTAPMAAFRYVVLYNSTALNGELIGFYDYGASIAPAVGEPFTVDWDGVLGVIDVQ